MPSAATDDSSRLAGAIARKRRRRAWAAVIGVVVVAIVIGGIAAGRAVLKGHASLPLRKIAAGSQPASSAAATRAVVASSSAETTSGVAEVPNVVGLGVDEATVVLHAIGLVLQPSQDGTTTADRPAITSQDPAAGTLADMGSAVRVGVPMLVAGAFSAKTKSGGAGTTPRFVVCIDPGHQAHSDAALEPLGPGSKELKPKVSGGSTGVSTGVPESEVALQLATNLQRRLQEAGVVVVMTRTTNDVDISNAERAMIANNAHASLFVRVHADASTDPSMCGVSTLYPATNKWTQPIFSGSKRAAAIVQASVVHETGAVDNGAVQRSDLAGFNWSKVPSILVEAGFLSNTVEDRLLTSPNYQDEVASGMSDGILTYLRSRGR